MAKRYDFRGDRAAGFGFGFRWRATGGAPVELANAIFSVNSTPDPVVWNTASGHVTLGDEDVEYRGVLWVPAADLTDLDAGVFDYDFTLVRASDGHPRLWTEGGFVVAAAAVTVP